MELANWNPNGTTGPRCRNGRTKQRNRTRFSRAQPCGKTNGTKRGSLDAARRSIATTRIMASSLSKKISANIVIIHFVNLCLTVWQ